jgi:nicotinamidase-related amidase
MTRSVQRTHPRRERTNSRTRTRGQIDHAIHNIKTLQNVAHACGEQQIWSRRGRMTSSVHRTHPRRERINSRTRMRGQIDHAIHNIKT